MALSEIVYFIGWTVLSLYTVAAVFIMAAILIRIMRR